MIPKCRCESHEDHLVPHFSPENTDFVRCRLCGMVLRNPMPTIAELDKIYADLYQSDQIVQGKTNQESGSQVLMRYAEFLSRKVLLNGTKVLDYGCGSGVLVGELRALGYRAVGVERTSQAREFARRQRGLELLADIDEVDDGSLDAVTMIEVVEHLTNPAFSLNAIRVKLRPGGILFITTPNVMGLRARVEKARWREAQKQFHVVFFDVSSLSNLIEAVGMHVERHIKFSPVQRSGFLRSAAVRMQQALGLSGTVCLVARKMV